MTSSAAGPLELRRLARQLLAYLAAQSGRLVGALIIVPLYAIMLPPAELGIVVTVQVTASVLYVFAGGGLSGGLFRHLVEYRMNADRAAVARILVTALIAITGAAFVGALVTVAGLVLMEAIGAVRGWLPYAVPALIAMVAQAPRDVAERDLRARDRAGAWGLFTTAHQLLMTGSVLALLVLDRHEAAAVLWAAAAVNAAFAVASIGVLGRDARHGAWSNAELRAMLRFGLPTIPAAALSWVLQFSDRFVLAAFVSLQQVGIYSLGWRMGQFMEQVGGAGTQAAWDPFIFQQYRQPDAARTIGRGATYMALVSMLLLVPSVAASAPFLEVIGIAERYRGAESVVLLVGFSYWLALLRHIILAPTATHIRTEAALPVWIVAAIVNVALMFLLIPPFGFMGAAWATVLAYLAAIPVAIRVSRTIWVIEFEWRRLAQMAAAGVVVGVISNILVLPGDPVLRFLVEPTLAVAGFLGLLTVTGFFRRDEVQQGRVLLLGLRGWRP